MIDRGSDPTGSSTDGANVPGNVDWPTIDLLILLAQWDTAGSCDTDGSGTVDVVDLLEVLAAWGACP